MKLEVHERILLMNLLPKEGDYAALKAIRRARESISFSPQEKEEFEIHDSIGPDGKPQVMWDGNKASQKIKDVPIDEYITNVIRDELAKMNKQKKLTEQWISLYEKFVVMYQ